MAKALGGSTTATNPTNPGNPVLARSGTENPLLSEAAGQLTERINGPYTPTGSRCMTDDNNSKPGGFPEWDRRVLLQTALRDGYAKTSL